MMQPSAPPAPNDTPPRVAVLRYALSGFSDSWIVPEEPVPESAWHDRCLEVLKAILDAWVAEKARNMAVFRDIVIQARREKPRVGWNPDVCVVSPAPPGAWQLESMRLWDHAPPFFAFEAVSPNHPYKDYAIIPEKCAVAGVGELCVFDPLLAGPRSQGGPWLLQVWRRAADGGFERIYAGDGPSESSSFGAWLVPDRTARILRIADQSNGEGLWPTVAERAQNAEAEARKGERQAEERERQAKERERQAEERERQARKNEDDALRRVAELEAELRRRQ